MKSKGILLDRDGTLIRDTGYLHSVEQVEFLPGTEEALAILQNLGFRFVVVSNQSGIGRGLVTQAEVEAINLYIANWLEARGVSIQRFYFCPHLPTDACSCRKPKPGMLLQAIQDQQLTPEYSYMVGDKWSDIEAGWAAGVKPVLLTNRSASAAQHSRQSVVRCSTEAAQMFERAQPIVTPSLLDFANMQKGCEET